MTTHTAQPQGKTIYIAGPITGVRNYWEQFDWAETILQDAGFQTINPTCLPQGLKHEQYLHINRAMIDVADVVLFLPGWKDSEGACLEWAYCNKTRTPKYVSIEVLKMKEATR